MQKSKEQKLTIKKLDNYGKVNDFLKNLKTGTLIILDGEIMNEEKGFLTIGDIIDIQDIANTNTTCITKSLEILHTINNENYYSP